MAFGSQPKQGLMNDARVRVTRVFFQRYSPGFQGFGTVFRCVEIWGRRGRLGKYFLGNFHGLVLLCA